MRSLGHRSLPAALPFAVAGILIVSSVAFGASVFRSLVTPTSSATPVIVAGDDPTDPPLITDAPVTDPPATDAPATDAPVDPTPAQLTLTATTEPGKVHLTWSRYEGTDFAFYKVVRSTDAEATWPLGDGDKLVAVTDSQNSLTDLDCTGAGTFTYRVFAVKSADSSYEVLEASNPQTVTVAAPPITEPPAPIVKTTPKPESHLTAPPIVSLGGGISGTDNGDNTFTIHLTWSKYTGPYFNYYGIVKTGPSTTVPADPTLSVGSTPTDYSSDVNHTAQDYKFSMGTAAKTVKFKIWAYADQTFAVTGGLMPACTVETILGVSNVLTFTIPAKTVVITPAPSPTPTPTAPPTAPPTDTPAP